MGLGDDAEGDDFDETDNEGTDWTVLISKSTCLYMFVAALIWWMYLGVGFSSE